MVPWAVSQVIYGRLPMAYFMVWIALVVLSGNPL
jgi:hypothetical protein